jgi:hypothetical protein
MLTKSLLIQPPELTLPAATPERLTLNIERSEAIALQLRNRGANPITALVWEESADGTVWVPNPTAQAFWTALLPIASNAKILYSAQNLAGRIRLTITSTVGSSVLVAVRGAPLDDAYVIPPATTTLAPTVATDILVSADRAEDLWTAFTNTGANPITAATFAVSMNGDFYVDDATVNAALAGVLPLASGGSFLVAQPINALFARFHLTSTLGTTVSVQARGS